MMTNKFIVNKIKEKNFKNILYLSEQTKNLLPQKTPDNNKIIIKIKLKSPIIRKYISNLKKNKTKEKINTSKIKFDFHLENNKNNIGIINYKLIQPKNYYIKSNKLIYNISNLKESRETKLPNINDSKIRNKSLDNTYKNFNLTSKKICLGDLPGCDEDIELEKYDKTVIYNKINKDEQNINLNKNRYKLKKLILLRNSTNYRLNSNEKLPTEKNDKNRNAKLLQKYYKQKLMNYSKLIKKMEKESELKKSKMNEYINQMKENFESDFDV